MRPIRFVTRLIDDSHVVNEPLQAVRHLPRASRAMARRALDSLSVESTIDLQAGIRVTATRAAHHRSSIGVRPRYHGGGARAWLSTMFTFQRSGAFPPNLAPSKRIRSPRTVLGGDARSAGSANLRGPLLDHPSHGPALGSDLYSGRHRGRHRHQLRAIRSATISPRMGPGRAAGPSSAAPAWLQQGISISTRRQQLHILEPPRRQSRDDRPEGGGRRVRLAAALRCSCLVGLGRGPHPVLVRNA